MIDYLLNLLHNLKLKSNHLFIKPSAIIILPKTRHTILKWPLEMVSYVDVNGRLLGRQNAGNSPSAHLSHCNIIITRTTRFTTEIRISVTDALSNFKCMYVYLYTVYI